MGEPANFASGQQFICCNAEQRLLNLEREVASLKAELSFLKNVHERMRAVLNEEKSGVLSPPQSCGDFEVCTTDNVSTPSKMEPDLDETFFDSQVLDPRKTECHRMECDNEPGFKSNTKRREPCLSKVEVSKVEVVNYPFKEALLRNKAARKQIPGQTCDECDSFYEAAGYFGKEKENMVNRCSRHRGKHKRSRTPEGFWGFENLLEKL